VPVDSGGKQAAIKVIRRASGFPQVFHRQLWTENRLFYKTLGRFYTFTQGLFLLLVLKQDLDLISIRKRLGERKDWKVGISGCIIIEI
jgi:hypothetical protein